MTIGCYYPEYHYIAVSFLPEISMAATIKRNLSRVRGLNPGSRVTSFALLAFPGAKKGPSLISLRRDRRGVRRTLLSPIRRQGLIFLNVWQAVTTVWSLGLGKFSRCIAAPRAIGHQRVKPSALRLGVLAFWMGCSLISVAPHSALADVPPGSIPATAFWWANVVAYDSLGAAEAAVIASYAGQQGTIEFDHSTKDIGSPYWQYFWYRLYYYGVYVGTSPFIQLRGQCPSGTWLDVDGDACVTTRTWAKNLGSPSFCPTGDPINQGIGNHFQIEVDYTHVGATQLEFHRTYNSDAAAISTMAPHWRGSYDRSITEYTAGPDNGIAYAVRQNGKVYSFTLSNSVWLSDADIPDKLTQLTDASGTTTGWRYTTADDAVETYDAAGKLFSITSRNGLTQTLTYSDGTTGPNGGYVLDGAGNPTTMTLAAELLIRVTGPFGRQLAFGYDSTSRIVKMTDPAGGTYLYAYDANNNLVSVTYPDGKSRQYLYNEPAYTSGADLPHALTGLIDENGIRYATWNYDAQGQAISSEHANGVDKYTLAYTTDSSGNPVSTVVTDPLGTARTYGFTTVLGVVKNTSLTQACGSCGGSSAATTYDANGNIASRTDFNGNQTVYGYDLTRNLETSRTEASGTPLARTITTQWDPNFRLPDQIGEPGRTTTFTYDTQGNVLTRTVTDSVTGQSRTWTYTYTAQGLLASVDGPRIDVSDLTTYSYDAQGNLSAVTNALNQATQITAYDPNGRPLTVQDPNGLVTTLAYDPRGRLISRTVGNETTTYAYDGVGDLTQVTLPDGSTIAYTYDPAHRLTDIADSLGDHLHYTLDAMGNRTKEDAYDPANALAQTRSRVYDALNHLVQEIGAQNQVTAYSYDANGNRTAITDPLSHTTARAFDALNRLIQVTDPAGGVTAYGYDNLDRLTGVTDPRHLVTSYSYDGLNDLTRTVSPDSGTTNRTYDSAGNLKTATDARGITASYSYDALNRVTGIAYSDGSQIAFQYDQGPNAVGRLSAMSDPSGSTVWHYDAQGQVSAKTQTVGTLTETLQYAYDNAGHLAQITYPSGRVVSYSYAAGRIAAIAVDGQPLLSGISYRPFGAVAGWAWGNGSAYARSFDQDGQLTGFPLGPATRAVSYDAAGRITAIADPNPALIQSYSYDSLDRLTGFIADTTSQAYAYDADGNRTGLTIGATQYAYSYPADSNRLASVAGPVPKAYTYDPTGNITGDGTLAFAYDARGRLTQASTAGATTGFGINGLGQRVSKTAGGTPGEFVYDEGGRLIGTYDANGDPIQETVYLNALPVAVLK